MSNLLFCRWAERADEKFALKETKSGVPIRFNIMLFIQRPSNVGCLHLTEPKLGRARLSRETKLLGKLAHLHARPP